MSNICQNNNHVEIEFERVDAATTEFVELVQGLEKKLRKSGNVIPSDQVRDQVADAFWKLFEHVKKFCDRNQDQDLSVYKCRFRERVMPLLGRSKYFWRSYAKPNGYAGDFKIIEWMYELEGSAGKNPTEPAIVNCLDFIFSTNHSVVGLWERRRWLRDLVASELQRKERLSVLDVACGGARYLRDVFEDCADPGLLSVTLLDQDPAALNYAEEENLGQWKERVGSLCLPIKHLQQCDELGEYDLIISSGLFDYLDEKTGSSMMSLLAQRLKSDGILAITNYHVDDPSAITKDWCADWSLVFRKENEVERLFPPGLEVRLERSQNESLIMATGRKVCMAA